MTQPVLFETLPTQCGKSIAIITLNSEKSLNALSKEMVELITPQLESWENDSQIVCVFFKSAGDKAFCAGGDIRNLYDSIIESESGTTNEYAQEFFTNEYKLDYLIHKYNKPIILWGHGIVMGGGIGLMSGASHRVVTEKSRLAMPEINIGLFPDVGSTWFLSRAPGRTGMFLGLTGANINAADALYIGLADRFLAHEVQAQVLEQLTKINWSDDITQYHQTVTSVLKSFEDLSTLPDSPVKQHFDLIQTITDGESAQHIAEQIFAVETDDKWLSRAIAGLKAGCPTTAHLVIEQLKRGENLSLEEIFQMELIMVLRCCQRPDFPEGVRALLVDKDGSPQWQHASIAEVPSTWVNEHFDPLWPDKLSPLSDLKH